MKNQNPIATVGKVVLYACGGLAAAAGFALIFGYIAMLLWNWLLVDIFGFKAITFLQAIGLIILAKLLFGFSPHPHPHPHKRRDKRHSHLFRNDKWHEGPFDMDEEDREALRRYWQSEGKEAFKAFKKQQEEE